MKKIIQKNLANMVTIFGIIIGIIACFSALKWGSWVVAEILFIISLITDGIDGKIARRFGSTRFGGYLDDIADFINFGIHPAIWIWMLSDMWWLGVLFAVCILGRLIRFTLYKQESSSIFSGLPSPAAAVGMFGIIFLSPSSDILLIATLLFSFLAVSHIRFIHIMKYQKFHSLRVPLGAIVIFLPILFGYHEIGFAITHLVIIGSYILCSLIFLVPHYARR